MTMLTSSTSVDAATSLLPQEFFSGIGSWLVSTWLNALLEGVLLQQTFQYFQLYRSDPPYMKIWVFVPMNPRGDRHSNLPCRSLKVIITVASQTASLALSMHTAYFYLVTNYFNPGVVVAGAVISAKAITNLAVELFFVRRVYYVGTRYRVFAIFSVGLQQHVASRSHWNLCVIHELFTIGGYMAYDDSNVSISHWFRINSLIGDTSTGGLGGSNVASPTFMLAADIQLTGVLIYALHTSRSGLARTNSMINMLILYAVSTAAMNVGGQGDVPPLLLKWTDPSCIFIVYSNSFIVALNTRRLVQKRGEMTTTAIIPSSSVAFQGIPGSGSVTSEMELQSMAFAPPGGTAPARVDFKEAIGTRTDSTAVLDFKLISDSSDSQNEKRPDEDHSPV
ncbi:hypothetical protein V8D89_008921 [Ganoderma adspersum]